MYYNIKNNVNLNGKKPAWAVARAQPSVAIVNILTKFSYLMSTDTE